MKHSESDIQSVADWISLNANDLSLISELTMSEIPVSLADYLEIYRNKLRAYKRARAIDYLDDLKTEIHELTK